MKFVACALLWDASCAPVACRSSPPQKKNILMEVPAYAKPAPKYPKVLGSPKYWKLISVDKSRPGVRYLGMAGPLAIDPHTKFTVCGLTWPYVPFKHHECQCFDCWRIYIYVYIYTYIWKNDHPSRPSPKKRHDVFHTFSVCVFAEVFASTFLPRQRYLKHLNLQSCGLETGLKPAGFVAQWWQMLTDQ